MATPAIRPIRSGPLAKQPERCRRRYRVVGNRCRPDWRTKKVSPAYEVFCQRKARPSASGAIPRLLSEPSFSNLKKEEDCKTVETSIRRQGFPKQIQSLPPQRYVRPGVGEGVATPGTQERACCPDNIQQHWSKRLDPQAAALPSSIGNPRQSLQSL